VSRRRFNPAPGWPDAPAPDWLPPDGWAPDPSWTPAPEGWPLTVTKPGIFNKKVVQEEQDAIHKALTRGYLQQRAAALRAETGLRQVGGMDLLEVQRLIETEKTRQGVQEEQWRGRLRDLEARLAAATEQVAEREQRVVQLDDVLLLQEVGVYESRRPGHDSAWHKAELERVRADIKAMVKRNTATESSSSWQVNNSAREGTRMVNQISKLMLRAYNNEADVCVKEMRPYKLESMEKRLERSAAAIEKLGTMMSIRIARHYHRLRLKELEITADYLDRLADEKEEQKAERERLREEAAAEREIAAERARLAKEVALKQRAIKTAEAELRAATGDRRDELERAIEELRGDVDGLVDSDGALADRLANRRAGHVYVISNVGAMGKRMVKIGMTRRLDPMERVIELGDASVPFKFDVHALIFDHDAVALEGRLHAHFRAQRVNLVNMRREFFYATPVEVREALHAWEQGHLLQFEEQQLGEEFHMSENARAALTA